MASGNMKLLVRSRLIMSKELMQYISLLTNEYIYIYILNLSIHFSGDNN